MILEETNLSFLVKNHPYPILHISKTGQILFANKASMPVLAHLGKNEGEIVPSPWVKMLKDIESSLLAQTLEISEMGLRLELTISLVESGTGGFVVFGRDITYENELKEQVLQVARKESVMKMVATYSHEINNPLTIAIGAMDLGYTSFTAELFGMTRKALGRIETVLDKIKELQNQTIQYQNYVGESEMVELNMPKTAKKSD